MPLLAELFDLALVDLDGVVYVGPDAVPGSVDAIAQSHRLGLRTCAESGEHFPRVGTWRWIRLCAGRPLSLRKPTDRSGLSSWLGPS